MIPQEAVLRFADQQKKLLRQTYDKGWRSGIAAYKPDADPDREPTLPQEMATAGLVGAALLAARRAYRYSAPAHPDPVRRAVALAPGFQGVNDMAGELMTMAGTTAATMDTPAALLGQWVDSNGWRLAAGAAVAWAGEQAGYAEAANADGQYLYAWMSVGDNRVCPDCEILSTFPPLPLDQWPTSPGSGDTECSYGCRCGWDVYPLDQGPASSMSANQQQLAQDLALKQADTLQSMIPEAAYLN